MYKNYAQKLKDPRWQKKRLEILQRDNFTCKSCSDKNSTLHVHHMVADYSIEPWEHEDKDAVTLCETCHAVYHLLIDLGYDIEVIISVSKFIDKWQTEDILNFLKISKS